MRPLFPSSLLIAVATLAHVGCKSSAAVQPPSDQGAVQTDNIHGAKSGHDQPTSSVYPITHQVIEEKNEPQVIEPVSAPDEEYWPDRDVPHGAPTTPLIGVALEAPGGPLGELLPTIYLPPHPCPKPKAQPNISFEMYSSHPYYSFSATYDVSGKPGGRYRLSLSSKSPGPARKRKKTLMRDLAPLAELTCSGKSAWEPITRTVLPVSWDNKFDNKKAVVFLYVSDRYHSPNIPGITCNPQKRVGSYSHTCNLDFPPKKDITVTFGEERGPSAPIPITLHLAVDPALTKK